MRSQQQPELDQPIILKELISLFAAGDILGHVHMKEIVDLRPEYAKKIIADIDRMLSQSSAENLITIGDKKPVTLEQLLETGGVDNLSGYSNCLQGAHHNVNLILLQRMKYELLTLMMRYITEHENNDSKSAVYAPILRQHGSANDKYLLDTLGRWESAGAGIGETTRVYTEWAIGHFAKKLDAGHAEQRQKNLEIAVREFNQSLVELEKAPAVDHQNTMLFNIVNLMTLQEFHSCILPSLDVKQDKVKAFLDSLPVMFNDDKFEDQLLTDSNEVLIKKARGLEDRVDLINRFISVTLKSDELDVVKKLQILRRLHKLMDTVNMRKKQIAGEMIQRFFYLSEDDIKQLDGCSPGKKLFHQVSEFNGLKRINCNIRRKDIDKFWVLSIALVNNYNRKHKSGELNNVNSITREQVYLFATYIVAVDDFRAEMFRHIVHSAPGSGQRLASLANTLESVKLLEENNRNGELTTLLEMLKKKFPNEYDNQREYEVINKIIHSPKNHGRKLSALFFMNCLSDATNLSDFFAAVDVAAKEVTPYSLLDQALNNIPIADFEAIVGRVFELDNFPGNAAKKNLSERLGDLNDRLGVHMEGMAILAKGLGQMSGERRDYAKGVEEILKFTVLCNEFFNASLQASSGNLNTDQALHTVTMMIILIGSLKERNENNLLVKIVSDIYERNKGRISSPESPVVMTRLIFIMLILVCANVPTISQKDAFQLVTLVTSLYDKLKQVWRDDRAMHAGCLAVILDVSNIFASANNKKTTHELIEQLFDKIISTRKGANAVKDELMGIRQCLSDCISRREAASISGAPVAGLFQPASPESSKSSGRVSPVVKSSK